MQIDFLLLEYSIEYLIEYSTNTGSRYQLYGGPKQTDGWILIRAPAQRKRATMLYFANVFIYKFIMAALFSSPGERKFAKVLHAVDLECH